MRRFAVLLLALAAPACDGVNPEQPPDAGCEARPPTDWEVLVGEGAANPRFHDDVMFFERDENLMPEANDLTLYTFDLASRREARFRVVGFGDVQAGLVAVHDDAVWLFVTGCCGGLGEIRRYERLDPDAAPTDFCRDRWYGVVGDEAIYCSDPNTRIIDASPPALYEPSPFFLFDDDGAQNGWPYVLDGRLIMARGDVTWAIDPDGTATRLFETDPTLGASVVGVAAGDVWFIDRSWQLQRVSAEGGQPEPVLAFAEDSIRGLIADGERIYWTSTSVEAFDPATGERLTADFPSSEAPRLAVHGDHLYAWGDGNIYRTPRASLGAATECR